MDRGDQTTPGRRVSAEEAHAWLSEQYAAGWQPAPALPSEVLIPQLGRFSMAVVLGLREEDDVPPLSGTGHRFSNADADRAARGALRWLMVRGGRTLVVEDDVGVRDHPGLTDVAFVGDRLLRWRPLTISCREATELLRTGALGYPRNAYVCDTTGDALGLEVGKTLGPVEVRDLASHVQAVLSAVWDDECYVLCWSPTGSAATTP